MIETADWMVPTLGGLGGVVLGLAARLGRVCSLSAIEDAVFGAGTARLITWALALGVAMLGTTILDAIGFVPVQSVFYLTNPVPILSTIIGGLAFGLGMALVGTCGFGSVARLGGGDLSGLIVVLVIGMTSYVASGGALGVLRAEWLAEAPTIAADTSLAHLLRGATGLPTTAIAGAIAAAIILFSLVRLRADASAILWGSLVGAVIVLGWAATSWHHDASFGERTVRSYSFVRPLGDTMIYAMTSSGTAIRFGVTSVVGVLVGAFAGAMILREFRWEACDDARTLKRQIAGAALMGTGGVFAMGCTVGQGLSAASVLAISAPIALLSMFVGAWLGLQWLVNGNITDPLRALILRRP